MLSNPFYQNDLFGRLGEPPPNVDFEFADQSLGLSKSFWVIPPFGCDVLNRLFLDIELYDWLTPIFAVVDITLLLVTVVLWLTPIPEELKFIKLPPFREFWPFPWFVIRDDCEPLEVTAPEKLLVWGYTLALEFETFLGETGGSRIGASVPNE